MKKITEFEFKTLTNAEPKYENIFFLSNNDLNSLFTKDLILFLIEQSFNISWANKYIGKLVSCSKEDIISCIEILYQKNNFRREENLIDTILNLSSGDIILYFETHLGFLTEKFEISTPILMFENEDDYTLSKIIFS